LLLTVVVETAVIGEPHPLLGESVTAFIVLRVGTSHSELEIKQHCRAAGMPHYMIPRRVVFLDSLPKTPHGKVDKAALRGQAASAADN
jgi:acyl-coenzyme A synthetase/AMP-(fatty) acid ligase